MEAAWTPSYLHPDGLGGKLRIQDLPREQRNAKQREYGQKFRCVRIEKRGGPRQLLCTAEAEQNRAKARKSYHKKKEQDHESVLANGREHQRKLRIARAGGIVAKLVSDAIKNVMRPYKSMDAHKLRMEQQAVRNKERYHSDDVYRTSCRLRARCAQFLGQRNIPKRGKTFRLMNASPAEAHQHMLSQLLDGDVMNDMEFDHIFPFACHHLRSKESQKRVMHVSNLQPLTFAENRDKSDKLPTKAMAAKVERWAWPPGVTEDMLPDIYDGWATPLRM
jgi:hypothetical protein